MGRDFPNKGENLYGIIEAMHVWKPLKKDNEESGKPCRRKKMEFIMPIVEPINNWTWVGFFEDIEKEFCNASSNVLFNIFNKMNSDLAYFDMSHNIEILHLNDSNEFKNEINKQLEKKIEPMEPILETINLGNNENPCLFKIGLSINERERKDLQELLMEFQEVFAWSYGDIPRVDPEIAQHHIDTHDHMVPVKQNLRRMRTE